MNKQLVQTEAETRVSAGEAILRSLKLNGVDKLFINPGSDFAPVIEALAAVDSDEIPEAIPAAHENVVVCMAHGYYLATGKMQAAAVHVPENDIHDLSQLRPSPACRHADGPDFREAE